jgi:hypothetical protein
MTDQVIPEDVYRFIWEKIDSVAQLEALLQLRASPERDWDALMLAERLYISREDAQHLIQELDEEGFVIPSPYVPGSVRYARGKREFDALLEKTADIYARFLVPVTRLIHSKPKSRVQKFADAFRVRKDRNDG